MSWSSPLQGSGAVGAESCRMDWQRHAAMPAVCFRNEQLLLVNACKESLLQVLAISCTQCTRLRLCLPGMSAADICVALGLPRGAVSHNMHVAGAQAHRTSVGGSLWARGALSLRKAL